MLGNGYDRKRLKERIEETKERLQHYRDKERSILDSEGKSGVRNYTIGTMSISRYEASLGDITRNIDKLERELDYLEGLYRGIKPRKVLRVVPRD